MRNKKAMFFTIIAISLLSLALFSFSIFSMVRDREAINKRIETMNNFVFSLEKDLERKLFISGFRIIFLFEKRILEDGVYISNVSAVFDEALFNGTIEGVIRGDEASLITGVTFSDIQSDLIASASKVNLDLTLSNPVLSISQKDPWNIYLVLRTNFLVEDFGKLASWNKTLITEAYVPVVGFEDPIYLINTNGKIFQKINQTPYTTFTSGSDVSNLNDHVSNSYYTNSTLSPSFIMRLEGNLSASDNGIESLVYLPDLSAQGITLKDKSVVDSIYFSSNDPTKYNIQGMPSWFKLDDAHLDMYGVSNLTI